eukprot:s740_g19.t1
MSSLGDLGLRIVRSLGWLSVLLLLGEAARRAYRIRLYAIQEYGPVIHEFDPWFNYRAAEYLATHGWKKFFTWFDHQSWYPLGRPVATTIYPGMQITAVALWQTLRLWDPSWTLNLVCCYMPAWLGAVSSVFSGLLALECSGGLGSAAVVSSLVMAILPAHLSRSVGGGFDNESVAVPAMCATFFFWCRALRSKSSWPIAALAGLAYAYMAASWGGYILVLNMVGLHAGLLMLLGSEGQLYAAYTLFFAVGTSLAIQVPVVSWTPLRSAEQLGPLVLFFALQLRKVSKNSARELGLLAMFVLVVALLIPSGFIGPFSVRVRALFVKHTKTGNPLVDSVAEHQPGSPDAFLRYLGLVSYVAPLGVPALLLRPRKDVGLFLLALGAVSLFFSLRMRRLVILMALPASALTGCALGLAFEQLMARPILGAGKGSGKLWNRGLVRVLRLGGGLVLGHQLWPQAQEFLEFCEDKARWSLSHPTIVTKARNGQIIDDYREAYNWLRDNTPEDARVMAWWDYGYQIAGIANRTTIADGNTWNHEHIALLGLCLSSPVPEAHAIARHLADYALVWAGGGGKDDVGKSKHMARIANSVYKGHCAEEDCDAYGIFPDGRPSKMMKASLVYGLCGRAELDPRLFEKVYFSKNRRVRILKVHQVAPDSRSWSADPENRLCDAPGSWYCPGTYPPALKALFKKSPEAVSEAARYQAAYEARVQEQLLERPLPNGDGLPEGSFLDSCRGCRITEKGLLSCSHCRQPGSPSASSSLDLATCWTPQVNNIHGQLQCEPKPNDVGIPAGGYQQSCKGCALSNGLLECSHCSTAAGRQMPSAFPLNACPAPASLDNDNGKLRCQGLPNEPGIPEGPYLNSCQGCQVQNAELSCKLCRRADGQQIAAAFSVSSCPFPARLDNQDGRLQCIAAKKEHEFSTCRTTTNFGAFSTLLTAVDSSMTSPDISRLWCVLEKDDQADEPLVRIEELLRWMGGLA